MITKEQAFTALENQTKLYYHDKRENKIGDMTPKIIGRLSDIRREIRSSEDTYSQRYGEPVDNNNWAVCEYKHVHKLEELYLNQADVAAIVIQQKREEIEALKKSIV